MKLINETADGQYRLVGKTCTNCGINFFPEKQVCSKCYKSSDMKDIEFGTEGLLHTYSIVHRSYPQFKTPYCIGYVDLPEDCIRIFAPIIDGKPESLEIGTPMKLQFDCDEKGNIKYYFVRRS